MKKLVLAALALAGMASAASASVTTNIYSGFTGSGGGAPYSGLVGALTTPGISFATDTGYGWHPFGLGSFGSESLATIDVATAGNYTFTLNSDDGSLAYIDGGLAGCPGGFPYYAKALEAGAEYATPWAPTNTVYVQSNYTTVQGTVRTWNEAQSLVAAQSCQAPFSRENPPHYYPGNFAAWIVC